MDEDTLTDKNKSSKLPKYLTTVTPLSKTIALIIFIMFPFCGFYLGIKFNTIYTKYQDTNQVILPTSTPIQLSLIINYSDKNLYINKQYGFSFEFPKNWQVKESTLSEIQKNGTIIEIEDPNLERNFLGDTKNFRVSYFKNINNDYAKGGSWIGEWTYQNLDDLFTDKWSPIHKTGNTTVDGLKAYEVTLSGHGMNFGVFIESPQGLYELTFPRAEEKKDLNQAEKEILSSFKFLLENTSGKISETDATNLVKNLSEVKQWLSLFTEPGKKSSSTGGTPIIIFDHKEGNQYVIHLYESVLSDGHSATFNWYKVNDATGEITKEFN